MEGAATWKPSRMARLAALGDYRSILTGHAVQVVYQPAHVLGSIPETAAVAPCGDADRAKPRDRFENVVIMRSDGNAFGKDPEHVGGIAAIREEVDDH